MREKTVYDAVCWIRCCPPTLWMIVKTHCEKASEIQPVTYCRLFDVPNLAGFKIVGDRMPVCMKSRMVIREASTSLSVSTNSDSDGLRPPLIPLWCLMNTRCIIHNINPLVSAGCIRSITSSFETFTHHWTRELDPINITFSSLSLPRTDNEWIHNLS